MRVGAGAVRLAGQRITSMIQRTAIIPPIFAPGPGLLISDRPMVSNALRRQEQIRAMLVEVEIELLERDAGLHHDLEVTVVQLEDLIHLGHVDADGVAALQIFALAVSAPSRVVRPRTWTTRSSALGTLLDRALK